MESGSNPSQLIFMTPKWIFSAANSIFTSCILAFASKSDTVGSGFEYIDGTFRVSDDAVMGSDVVGPVLGRALDQRCGSFGLRALFIQHCSGVLHC